MSAITSSHVAACNAPAGSQLRRGGGNASATEAVVSIFNSARSFRLDARYPKIECQRAANFGRSLTNFRLRGTRITFFLPTFWYTSAKVFVQPPEARRLLRNAVKPPSHLACWPLVESTKSRNSFADAGLFAFFVIAIPRGTSGCASFVYDQSSSRWRFASLAIRKRAVGEV